MSRCRRPGVAVLRYGLYELDLVISKTVAYAVLAAFFTIAYLAIVVGIGTVIGSSNNSFLTVLAAATIAVAFNPVRDRAKRFANRLVYGKRVSLRGAIGVLRARRRDLFGRRRPAAHGDGPGGGDPAREMPPCGCASAGSCGRPPRGATAGRRRRRSRWTTASCRCSPTPRRWPRCATATSCSER